MERILHIVIRRNILVIAALMSCTSLHSARAAEPKAPVIAVGEIVRGGSSYFAVSKLCLRDQVITELVNRYGCFVPYRSAPFAIPAEDPLGVPFSAKKAFPADLVMSSIYSSPSVKPSAIEGTESHAVGMKWQALAPMHDQVFLFIEADRMFA